MTLLAVLAFVSGVFCGVVMLVAFACLSMSSIAADEEGDVDA
jgi:hypothetical protein